MYIYIGLTLTPFWRRTKQESSPDRLTGCDHPNYPQRTTRATSTPRGIRTLDLLSTLTLNH